ncbi:hypothetical protein L21SP3_00892 [Sedimentisphaera cyanobacteriorum]|uniref:LamG-like jellyroll fold domain-containing protein n=1 Tax=Sedimentisphaera cyanobacteriorum TaxID=1940790 RepID=A0A1Q2HP81_9BACT|nr:LamG-like jellyroll fold domain-containing protein [Sedimentisphaera cyanobacteriorum]AQQ09094.1 hypothetical protein L21SP3_00892 [Sedimentisphaera cyanobacteriorum]
MKKYAFMILALVIIVSGAFALNWTGDNTDENREALWNDPANWGGSLPTINDVLWINNNAPVNIIVEDGVDAVCSKLLLSNGDGPFIAEVESGASLTVNEYGWAGRYGSGNGLIVNGGEVNFMGTATDSGNVFQVGYKGAVTGNFLEINGGHTFINGNVRCAEWGAATAAITMTGGELGVNGDFYGQSGVMTTNISGGHIDVQGSFWIKQWSGQGDTAEANFTGGLTEAYDFQLSPNNANVNTTVNGGYLRGSDTFMITTEGDCTLDLLSGVIDATIFRYDEAVDNTLTTSLGEGIIYADRFGYDAEEYPNYDAELTDDYSDVVGDIVDGDIAPGASGDDVYFAYYPESAEGRSDDFYVLSGKEPAAAQAVSPYDEQKYVSTAMTTVQWSNAPAVSPVGASGEAVTVDTSSQNANVISYEVYLGTDKMAVATDTGSGSSTYQGNVMGSTELDISSVTLEDDTVYFWRIDSVMSDSSVVKGRLNKFVTGTEPAGELAYHWKFDGSTTDEVQSAAAAPFGGGAPQFVDGFDGQAYKFAPDFSDPENPLYNFLTVGGTADNNLFRFGYTVTAWVNKLPGNWSAVFQKQDRVEGEPWKGWVCSLNGSDVPVTAARDYGEITAETAVNDGEWHFVAWSYDSVKNQIAVYVDGQIENKAQVSDSYADPSESNFFIGAAITDGEPASLFTGKLDDLRIYIGAMDVVEVAQMYTEAKPGETICLGPVGPMDFNDDCQVNLEDYAMMAMDWQLCNLIPVEDCE